MSEEMKRCPFCGNAGRHSLAQSKNGPNLYAVGCSKCIVMTEWVTDKADALAAWNTRAEPYTAAQVEKLVSAANRVLVGGNHLALLIGADHPPYTMSHAEALEHYGAGDTCEIWSCWKTIMELRAALQLFEHGAHDNGNG